MERRVGLLALLMLIVFLSASYSITYKTSEGISIEYKKGYLSTDNKTTTFYPKKMPNTKQGWQIKVVGEEEKENLYLIISFTGELEGCVGCRETKDQLYFPLNISKGQIIYFYVVGDVTLSPPILSNEPPAKTENIFEENITIEENKENTSSSEENKEQNKSGESKEGVIEHVAKIVKENPWTPTAIIVFSLAIIILVISSILLSYLNPPKKSRLERIFKPEEKIFIEDYMDELKE